MTDVLSEVLQAVRLTGAVFFTVEGSAPWVAQAPDAKSIARYVLPRAEHVIEYHVVTGQQCYAGLIGETPVELAQGDVIMFPQGDAHVVSSSPGMNGQADLSLFERASAGPIPISLAMNEHAPPQPLIVCGFLGCDARPFNPLLATLPRVMHVPARKAEGAWLEQLVRVAVTESSAHRAGGETMLARLSELLFIEAVRYYLSTLSSETTGWLAGLRDPLIGRTLSALHAQPAQAWSLEELAKAVGSSRSLLAERFHHFVGVPPMQYLARWRMQLSASMLTGTTFSLAEIAQRVGYGSEAALSRAFKRLVGVAPSAWREGVRPDAAFVAPEE